MSDADDQDPATSASVDMIIQVAKGHPVNSVADQLRRLGMQVERELVRAGIVGGKAPLSLVDRMAKIPGVKMVRPADTFKVPPLSDKVPQ